MTSQSGKKMSMLQKWQARGAAQRMSQPVQATPAQVIDTKQDGRKKMERFKKAINAAKGGDYYFLREMKKEGMIDFDDTHKGIDDLIVFGNKLFSFMKESTPAPAPIPQDLQGDIHLMAMTILEKLQPVLLNAIYTELMEHKK